MFFEFIVIIGVLMLASKWLGPWWTDQDRKDHYIGRHDRR